MGSLWEPYGKGVPFLGAPGNSLDDKSVLIQSTKRISSFLELPGINSPGLLQDMIRLMGKVQVSSWNG